MRKFISFSGGVESTTMCVLFGNKADAIFADTGFEHKLIYDQITKVQEWCKNFHRNDFTIHKVKSKYDTLPKRIIEQSFYPSFSSRYCTREFKIEPIDEFLEQFKDEGCELLIGLNYEEQNRIEKQGHGNKSFVKYSYPLAKNKLTRSACITILEKAGLKPDYPVYMKRGGCIGCFYKSVKQYVAMALLNPEEFAIVEKLEEELNTDSNGNNRKKYFKILGDLTKPSMKEIRIRAHEELFKPEDVYSVINDATPCGVFCNR
jgi:3'-phosphoadenosine 5'-phosphosulfate sulfotransferase (PAPS reductase)/FAD synthetase